MSYGHSLGRLIYNKLALIINQGILNTIILIAMNKEAQVLTTFSILCFSKQGERLFSTDKVHFKLYGGV
ncbi:MAG: hypothetical protein WKF59_16260 [Chitinophagaceae bacterium]